MEGNANNQHTDKINLIFNYALHTLKNVLGNKAVLRVYVHTYTQKFI